MVLATCVAIGGKSICDLKVEDCVVGLEESNLPMLP